MNLQRTFLEKAYRIISALSKYDSWHRFEKLMSSQYLPLQKLKEIQWSKLEKLLNHAYKNVPFYRELWDANAVNLIDIHSPDDINLFPIVDREALQASPPEMIKASNLKGESLAQIQTSGSTTGRPFRFFINEHAYFEKYALYLREKTPSGWQLGDKVISMWNRSHSTYKGAYDGNTDTLEPYPLIRRFANLLFERKMILAPFDRLGSGVLFKDVERHVKAIKDFNPRVFESFNFLIAILCRAMERYSIEPLDVPIIYYLGPLTQEHSELVRRNLSGEIFDRFGPHEMEGVAYECEAHTGLHISMESYIVEFLPVDDNNGLSELVITDLDNFATPLIRYKIGDIAHPLERACPCGRTLPLMSHILGRSADLISTESGKALAPAEIENLMSGIRGVAFFSLEQRRDCGLTVTVVQDDRGETIDKDEIKSRLGVIVGASLPISVSLADEIPSEKNGKFRFVKKLR